MAKLWEKGVATDSAVERFTVGEDYIHDMRLVRADILGNIAHARTLKKAGSLTQPELQKLEKALVKLLALHKKGGFSIPAELEDVHTATENYLTESLGPLGKKVHTGRSRNDQVMVDMRIYMREAAGEISAALLDSAESMLNFADKHKDVPMPGFTHTRAAMPSSVGLWAGAIAESLLDDTIMLNAAYSLIDQCPLGSAAGYGVPLPLDREYTAKLLGFSKVHKNVIAAQNGRGKFELALVSACQQIMAGLSRAAADIIFFTLPEFGFLRLPDRLTTGSSIMPQKRNPDTMELVRASAHAVNSAAMELASNISGLLSGYNRDLQLTKGVAMKALATTRDSLEIMKCTFDGLKVDAARCKAALAPEIFAADAALELAVKKNIPFRDAYKLIAENPGSVKTLDPVNAIKTRKHTGGAGNLGIAADRKRLASERAALKSRVERVESAFAKLTKPEA